MKKPPLFDRKYLSRVAVSVCASIFALGVLFYIGYHMSGKLKDGISTFFARAEAYPDNIECSGYILMDETPISNPHPSASLTPTVDDGGRVSVGGKVADVYTVSSDALSEKIAIVEEQIEFYEKCRDTHATIGDTVTVRRSISSDIIELRRAAEKGNLRGSVGAKQEILRDISTLNVMTGKVTDFDSMIVSLNTDLATLKLGLGSMIGSVYSPTAGYYFSECDGYEGILSSAELDTLTYSSMTELLAKADAHTPTVSGSSAGKVMNTFKWYVSCPMSSTEAARLTEGNSYTITLSSNENTPLTMKLYSVLSNAAESIAVFECSTVTGDFDYTRLQDASITVDTVSCFSVPVSSVRYYEGMRGVYILDQTTVDFRRIEVFDERGGEYLCYISDPNAKEEAPAETVPADTEEPTAPVYLYMQENDIVITGGTGLYVGMTYDNKR